VAKTSRSEVAAPPPRGGPPESPRTRLFVALELPEDYRSRLVAWRDEAVAAREDMRPVAASALHVTLVFLGWQAEKDLARVAAVVGRACSGRAPARLLARGVVGVPSRRPRLFALDLEDGGDATRALQAALADELSAARFYGPEKRPFWPHVTLARVRRGRRAEMLESVEPPPSEPFDSAAVTLYRSTLRPQGALYEPLERLWLSGRA